VGAVSLRPATPDDAAAVAACVHAAYQHYVARIGKPPGPMLEDYANVIRLRQVFVAEDGGRTAGILVLGVMEEGFRLINVAVHPSFQKQGVGRMLLQFAEAEARRLGHAVVHLSTNEKMTENQALYAKIGYVEYDRRTENGYSRVFMRKTLRDAGKRP
jgi:ribosomal protein S18 acetylase RimI-like enzyme